MNRREFEQLRNLPGKTIDQDIAFVAERGAYPNLVFDGVSVQNDLGWDVVLNGTYKPDIPSVSFNFVLRGVGPVCRMCINGTIHKDQGRTHKHDLRQDADPRRNIPEAIARPDLEGKTVAEVWQTLCRQANIEHRGCFTAPDAEGS